MKPITALLITLATFLGISGNAQIVNSSFESGMTGWTVSANVGAYGPAIGQQARGTDGNHAAELGTFDSPNTYFYQSLSLSNPSTYAVSFHLGAASPSIGLIARVRVIASNAVAGVIGSNQYSVTSSGSAGLRSGFITNTLQFTVPSGASPVILYFIDTTSSSGVDPLIDQVSIAVSTPVPSGASNLLFNPGFEFGLIGWRSSGVVVYGPPTFNQIGTEGTNAAGLGGTDTSGAFLEQNLPAEGAYTLSFDIAAMGSAGLRSLTLLQIVDDNGFIVMTDTITNFGNGLVPFGRPPFQLKTYSISIPTAQSNLAIRLSDISANNGVGIDAILDNFSLIQTAGPLRIRMYPGLTLTGAVGTTQRVDYAETVVGGVTNWNILTNVVMTNVTITVIDFSAPPAVRRFYRSVVVP